MACPRTTFNFWNRLSAGLLSKIYSAQAGLATSGHPLVYFYTKAVVLGLTAGASIGHCGQCPPSKVLLSNMTGARFGSSCGGFRIPAHAEQFNSLKGPVLENLHRGGSG